MKIFFYILVIFTICSCHSENENRPLTAMDTGRSFIEECMKGDFKNAESLLLKDSANVQLFSAFRDFYDRMPAEKKENYSKASYIINKYSDITDSVTIINYSNDYMNKPMEIKIVRFENNWFVDFKYTYSGNLPIN